MVSAELDPRLYRLISGLLAKEVGSGARWRIYDRSLRTPMNSVLDAAAQHLEEDFIVVWVDGGYPEVFTLTGLPIPVTVFSTRYLELSSFVRALFVDDVMSASLRTELVERAVLKVVAELSLRRGNADAAVRCFARSIIGKRIWVPDTGLLTDLEITTVSEAYVASWFFGLVHELGHSAPVPFEDGLLGAAELEQNVRLGIESFDFANELDIDEQMAIIRRDRQHPLRPEHLRGEVAADLFSGMAAPAGGQATGAVPTNGVPLMTTARGARLRARPFATRPAPPSVGRLRRDRRGRVVCSCCRALTGNVRLDC